MSAPPGHNPEASMLQGGTASITPMQGGGGPPPGYSGESLIQGGTAAITPMQGGASVETILLEKQAEFNAIDVGSQRVLRSALAKGIKEGNSEEELRAIRDRFLENRDEDAGSRRFQVKLRDTPIPTGPIKPFARSASNQPVPRRVRAAATRAAPLAAHVVTNAKPVPVAKEAYPVEYYSISQRVGYNDAPIYTYLRAKEFFLQTHDAEFKNHLIALMNNYEQRRIKEVWIKGRTAATLPTRGSIRGTPQNVLTQFSRAVHELPEKKAVKHLIIVPPINGNVNMLVNVLTDLEKYDVITTEDGKINILEKNILVFMPPYYTEPIRGKDDNRGKNIALLSIFLEIEAANKNQIFVLTEHTAKSYNVGEVFHEYRSGTNNPFLNFLEPSYILGHSLLLTTASPLEPALPIAADAYWGPFRDNENAPEDALIVRTLGIEGTMDLPKLREDIGLTTGCTQYRGQNTLSAGQLALTKASVKDELGAPRNASIMLVVHLDGTAGPICKASHVTEEGDYVSPTHFYPSPKDKLIAKDAATIPIEFVDKDEANKTIYQIRIPRLNNAVFEDWNNGRYTEGETAFLNSLDIYPMMLEEIFRDDRWQTQVAFFLQSISISNCYNDDRLLLRSECEFNRNFLERIHAFFIEEGLTVDRRKQLRNLEDAAELDEYRRIVKEEAYENAQKAATLPEGVEKISRFQFHNTKKAFGTLYVYSYGENMAANFMLINQATGAVSYHRVSVKKEEYDANPKELENALKSIREKNSAFFVVY